MLSLNTVFEMCIRDRVWALAREQGISLPAKTKEETDFLMRVPDDCRTLEEYLQRFDMPLLVLQEESALERAAFELVEDLAKEGVDYAEIRFAPQLSLSHGLTQDQVTEAAIRGVKKGMAQYPGIRAGLIPVSYTHLCRLEDQRIISACNDPGNLPAYAG